MKLEKKILNNLKNDKNEALKAIEISILHWEDFKKKGLISKIFFKKKKFLHWQVSNLFTGLFHIHLRWSHIIIRSQTNIEKKDVSDALTGIKQFYSKISTIKPDLSHPDIIQCFNLTAKINKGQTKKIVLKEKIEVDIIDPFKNIIGKDSRFMQKHLTDQKKNALNHIEYSLFFINKSENKLDDMNYKNLQQPRNVIFNKKNKMYNVKLIWCEKELKLDKNLNKNEVKLALENFKKIINSFNISRPNLNDPLINKMYNISLVESEFNNKWLSIKLIRNIIKKYTKYIKAF